MIFEKAALTSVITMFGIAGAQAQNAPKPIEIPSVLAARFADMAGKWTISGTITSQGQSVAIKGPVNCSLVAAGTALLCTGNFDGPPGDPLTHVHIFAYDRAHKKVWVGVANNYSGAGEDIGSYTKNGLVIGNSSTMPDGKTEKEIQTIAGKIGSGEMKETIRTTIDGKPVVSWNLTWMKDKTK